MVISARPLLSPGPLGPPGLPARPALGLTCHTLNAFPYGDFHSERVKENVYLPDWTQRERLESAGAVVTRSNVIAARLAREAANG